MKISACIARRTWRSLIEAWRCKGLDDRDHVELDLETIFTLRGDWHTADQHNWSKNPKYWSRGLMPSSLDICISSHGWGSPGSDNGCDLSAPIQSRRPFDLPSAIFLLGGYHMVIDHGPHGGNGARLCISRIWSNGEIIEILSISLGLKALNSVQSIAQLP